MPGVAQTSVDELLRDAERAERSGLGGVILFGIPEEKDAEGSGAWDDAGPVPQAVRAIKRAFPLLVTMTDVCLCEYTSHGHCGVLHGDAVDNDETLVLLAREAVCHATAGADVIAPSDMMDGRVAAIRKALDDAGHAQLPILSYAAKYASAFTARSAKRPNRRRSSALAAATRWTRRIQTRRCEKCGPTSRREPT
jgi:porphobilinogen synthase